MNSVRLVISEDVASGSGTRLDHSELLCGRSFITVKRDRESFWYGHQRGTESGLLTSLQLFSSVAQSCPTLCDPMNRSMPGLPVHLPESTQTHAHQVGDAIQPSHPLSSRSPPALNLTQHQDLFQWVSSSHHVAKVLEFRLQHQCFQWTPRTGLL